MRVWGLKGGGTDGVILKIKLRRSPGRNLDSRSSRRMISLLFARVKTTPPNSASAWPSLDTTSAAIEGVGIRDQYKELVFTLLVVAFALSDWRIYGFCVSGLSKFDSAV